MNFMSKYHYSVLLFYAKMYFLLRRFARNLQWLRVAKWDGLYHILNYGTSRKEREREKEIDR